ncbi:MAG: MBL fold metallo-hydrolase [Planctomycetes bacterium]|nr:MBL fold metallo-hydrolase [Planctomycetota bacterium]
MKATHSILGLVLCLSPALALAGDPVTLSSLDPDFTPAQATKLRDALAVANRVLTSNEFRTELSAMGSFQYSKDDGAAVHRALLNRTRSLRFDAVARYAFRVRVGWKVFKRKSKMIASSSHGSGKITFNTIRMHEFGANTYAGTIAHELSHIAGYRHRGNRKTHRNLRSVPYRVGELVRRLAKGPLTFSTAGSSTSAETTAIPGQRGAVNILTGKPAGPGVAAVPAQPGQPAAKRTRRNPWSRLQGAVRRLFRRNRDRKLPPAPAIVDELPSGDLELHVIDLTAHGEALVLRTPSGKVVLIDGGHKGTSGHVASVLLAMGVETIDLMILSHSDPDHLDGLKAIANRVSVKRFWQPAYPQEGKRAKKIRALIAAFKGPEGTSTVVETVRRGATLEVDGVDLRVIAPFRSLITDAKSNHNANGIALASSRLGASPRACLSQTRGLRGC